MKVLLVTLVSQAILHQVVFKNVNHFNITMIMIVAIHAPHLYVRLPNINILTMLVGRISMLLTAQLTIISKILNV